MNHWEWIFRQSRVNNGLYDGDRLPAQAWDWPQQTWFQERLRQVRGAGDKSENKPAGQFLEDAILYRRNKRLATSNRPVLARARSH
jgi:hypothetical protein